MVMLDDNGTCPVSTTSCVDEYNMYALTATC